MEDEVDWGDSPINSPHLHAADHQASPMGFQVPEPRLQEEYTFANVDQEYMELPVGEPFTPCKFIHGRHSTHSHTLQIGTETHNSNLPSVESSGPSLAFILIAGSPIRGTFPISYCIRPARKCTRRPSSKTSWLMHCIPISWTPASPMGTNLTRISANISDRSQTTWTNLLPR
jgi:hypothetical protein